MKRTRSNPAKTPDFTKRIGAWLSVLAFGTTVAATAGADVSAPGALRFAIVKTSDVEVPEAITYSGGSWLEKATVSHAAILVEHPMGSFLFDTGLGANVDEQFSAEMPWWMKPFFGYGPVTPAGVQLERAHYPPIERIILSHAHWDHASGVPDFPDAEIWIQPIERQYIPIAPVGPVMPSQFASPSIRWREYSLEESPFLGFTRSHDIFGDESAVLVDLSGHTPGSVGLVLTLRDDRRFLFCGDVVWNAAALANSAPKSAIARWIVDADADGVQSTIDRLSAAVAANPELTIVPAHDGAVHEYLGFFPRWVEPRAGEPEELTPLALVSTKPLLDPVPSEQETP